MKRYSTPLLFVIALLAISAIYGYHKIVFKRPQSTHKWRQSDCASLALNYYENGMHFLQTETHNLTSDGGTTGKACTSEVPVLYYTVAALYKAFGYHDSIYRIFNTLLFFLGLFYLFRIFRYLLKDKFWAIALALFLFTSPVLVYYGNNYLSNSSALAFAMVGWFYFIRFYFEAKPKWFYVSMAVFLLAGALKVTALFSLFAIAGILTIEWLGIMKIFHGNHCRKNMWRYLIPIFVILLIIGAWLWHAHYFNHKHGCTYFSTNIFPIWDLSKVEIIEVLERIRKVWFAEYFHISAFIFIGCCLLFILIHYKKNQKFLISSILIVMFEILVYSLLQFWTFADHDYYTINMYILPVLILISTFDVLHRHYEKIFSSWYIKVAFLLLLAINIYHGHQKVNERYYGWRSDFAKLEPLHTITPYLRQIGVAADDTVISMPDRSHVTLYLMNQKGWTQYTDTKFNGENKIYYNQDSAGVQASINKGAKYLIINGVEEIYKNPYVKPYCTHLMGCYNGVLVFKLASQTKNFSIEQRTPECTFTCDAETVASDKKNFINPTDSTLFEYGTSQTDKFSKSGNYSAQVGDGSPYAMTIKIDDLRFGESFAITVWRKSANKASGSLIASTTPYNYYNNNYDVVQSGSNGWEQLRTEFFVNSKLADNQLIVYVYNSDKEPVYFDDLKIIRYRSIVDKLEGICNDSN